MTLFMELCSTKKHSAKMVPIENINDFIGYRSIYAFDKTATQFILASKSMRNLKQFAVHSDHFIADFDNGNSDQLKSYIDHLKRNNINYKLWFSGKKGYHVECNTESLCSKELPDWHWMYAKSLGLSEIDTSIYRHTGLIRLPGTPHEITGKEKALVEQQNGDKLVIPKRDRPKNVEPEIHNINQFRMALYRILPYIGQRPDTTRYELIYGAAANLFRAGFSDSTVLEIMNHLNESWDKTDQKSPEEIQEYVIKGQTAGKM